MIEITSKVRFFGEAGRDYRGRGPGAEVTLVFVSIYLRRGVTVANRDITH